MPATVTIFHLQGLFSRRSTATNKKQKWTSLLKCSPTVKYVLPVEDCAVVQSANHNFPVLEETISVPWRAKNGTISAHNS